MNSFFARRYVVTGIFIAISFILLARLFYMQIIDDRYLLFADKNVKRVQIVFPARGPILDRNGKILVENQPVYDVMVTPNMVKPLDTIAFCKLLGIDKEGFIKRLDKAIKVSGFTVQSVFEGQLSVTLSASLQERLTEFPGFEMRRNSVRSYPDSIAAQFLGYTGEVNPDAIKNSGGYYHLGDYKGITGVEKRYDSILRGQRGVHVLLVDSRGKEMGSFAHGTYDTVPVAGQRLISSLDSRIQKLGEQLMQHKVGSIVAIEPSSGEILAFVSSPGYNPNLMVGRDRNNHIADLYKNPYNPFLVRPIMARYPPGSSFKPLAALIALQRGIITPQTTYTCPGYYWAGNHKLACTHVHGTVNLSGAIEGSCNGYFCYVFEKLINSNGAKNTDTTYAAWKKQINGFGVGVKLGIDLSNENRGLMPTALYYDKIFGKGRWRSSTIISDAIGQGEVLATPLQLANLEATIANHGFYYKPHLIKGIGDKDVIKEEYTKRNYVGIDSTYFEPVIDGMQAVVDRGTGAGSRIPGIVMCGKTGTAQIQGKENNGVFVAYAPRDHPKIAIAVVVENAGQGAYWAAPIAAMMVEKYLRDSITVRPNGQSPQYFMDKDLLPALTVTHKPGVAIPKDTAKRRPDSPNVPKLIRSNTTNRNKKRTPTHNLMAMLNKKEDE